MINKKDPHLWIFFWSKYWLSISVRSFFLSQAISVDFIFHSQIFISNSPLSFATTGQKPIRFVLHLILDLLPSFLKRTLHNKPTSRVVEVEMSRLHHYCAVQNVFEDHLLSLCKNNLNRLGFEEYKNTT
ncbi:hypothetical protein A2318_04385 [Candidatus Uhrbacteria bacterium RIFOXYB2_FULL_45_11]|uniref:Uncharacterized protein n=1 Tax=Candidatus Uhrbacteria bacterium RIFOXYB2_FULL_45_11 TaxID=1802421 RepID=A0A1F7W943_9BACT|nr:MAG: hypothetical protein A2318_04385 [Candidatus Uhrbacteria bacterium RIFOXYB2_FULL_45_11]